MNTAYLNQRFVPLDKAKISILDRGFLYGDGVFETARSYEGIVFHLEKHLDRLFKSLKAFNIYPKINKLRMQRIVYELLEKNKLENAYIKIIVTRGKSSGLLIPTGRANPTTLVYARPYTPLSRNVYEKGIKIFVSEARFNENDQMAGKKTLNYLRHILYRYEAKGRGFDDAVAINIKGFVSETSSSNIFLVNGKRLYTPCLESGCLPGITRGEVIRIAREILKAEVNESFIKSAALYNAEEVFLTNSLAEIIPVTKIDNHIIGRGRPGPVTKSLSGLFKNAIKDYRKKMGQILR